MGAVGLAVTLQYKAERRIETWNWMAAYFARQSNRNACLTASYFSAGIRFGGATRGQLLMAMAAGPRPVEVGEVDKAVSALVAGSTANDDSVLAPEFAT